MFADFFVLILDFYSNGSYFNSISSHCKALTHLNSTQKLYRLQVDKRGTHILNLLRSFAPNIHKDLQELWDNRFPLLLHYLEQHDSVVSSQVFLNFYIFF